VNRNNTSLVGCHKNPGNKIILISIFFPILKHFAIDFPMMKDSSNPFSMESRKNSRQPNHDLFQRLKTAQKNSTILSDKKGLGSGYSFLNIISGCGFQQLSKKITSRMRRFLSVVKKVYKPFTFRFL
jgi:hypothetical protein